MQLEQIVPMLQLAIGPVIVISGVGLLLLSMTNRFGRIIDRSRILAESAHAASGTFIVHVEKQLTIMMRRAYLLRMAIAFVTLSLLLDSLLIIALFLSELVSFEASIFIIILFICCMLSLIAGLIYFLADINVSLSALKIETEVQQNSIAKA
ncbi:DUF2721 domain-containing protein [Desulfobulbus rhabdoformis]|uniref:DUF2721 domain-containing protein n=1 Tax=Desulfobulbus rhabdoformis TaxID=34032 RepID=UPI001964F9C2|nr:DUF2721 domain-containing protein [Desulfobulbus rhabdoformis]MBM9614671.1 DUF2721 domain-containing protein [Desulfobulbus rhabdoformis]